MPTADAQGPVEIAAPAPGNADQFDLGRLKKPAPLVRSRCTPSSADEITVCAPDPEQFRLRPLPNTYERGTGQAEIGLAEGVKTRVRADAQQLGGAISKRIMVDIKLGF